MKTKKKIFFVLPTLSAGGAERVISFVASKLDKNKFDVKLVIIGFEKDNKYDVSETQVIYLNKSRVLTGILPLSMMFLKQKPQIVLSSISNLNVMMGVISIFFPNTIFIGRHTFILKNISTGNDRSKNKSFMQSIFDYWNYGNKKLDHFICQSSDMKDSLINVYGIKSAKISIINNPVTQTNIFKTDSLQHEVKKYITVGRLTKVKGHIRILEILSKLWFPFHYTIIGEGINYEVIFGKVKELSLEKKVTYIKYTDKVFENLVKHDMFLQGSYSEGFPNALLESCAVGTPVIAFDVPGGTKEIVEDEVNGFLVNSPDEFLHRLYDKRDWDPKKVRESVYKKFDENKIIMDYESLFVRILNEHNL